MDKRVDKPRQLNIWITKQDHRELKKIAASDDRSMSSLMRKIIREEIERFKQKGQK